MKRLVSSTIWLPVTTVQAMSPAVMPESNAAFAASAVVSHVIFPAFKPASEKNVASVFFSAPILQRPQEVQRPVQESIPESTGFVRW